VKEQSFLEAPKLVVEVAGGSGINLKEKRKMTDFQEGCIIIFNPEPLLSIISSDFME
jgi:hypothetical protein